MRWSLLFALAFLLSACTLDPFLPVEEEAPAPATPVAGADFAASAQTWGVPQDLLLALAWHESFLTADVDDHHEHRPKAGLLGLTEDKLALGAELAGVSIADIEREPGLNVDAGAAVLSRLRDELAPEAPDATITADWWPVVVAWPELGEAWLDHAFAMDVFRTLQLGLEAESGFGESVTIPARRIPGLHAVDYIAPPEDDDEARATIGYPGRFRFHGAHSSNQSARSGGTSSIERVVLHTTEGSYNGAISWFRTSSSNVSAHYVLRKSDGQVTQMVSDDRRAWHACQNNADTIGIEHEGAAFNASTWTSAMLDSSARLTAWLVTEYNIPIDRNHIVGHGEIQPSNCSGRSDPGPYFPWDDYLDLVEAYANGGSPGDDDDAAGDDDDDTTSGGIGPLAFLEPSSGDSVQDPVTAAVQHPDSHIELWSGPQLLEPFIFDHPAIATHTFGSNGNKSFTARAYRASGSHLATRTIHFTVAPPAVGDDDDDSAPVDTTLHETFVQHVEGQTMRFTSTAGEGVAYVEYWIEGFRLPDDDTGERRGVPSDFELTYSFNFPGQRSLEVLAFDADGDQVDSELKTVFVPSEPSCAFDDCVTGFPYNDSNTTTGGVDAWDFYSCASSTNESGPEVVYEVNVPFPGILTATISDGAGVDVDVHILSAADPNACLSRGHISAEALVSGGTAYVVVDSWVGASGTVYDGAYTLSISLQ